jgi:hypothetical protein
MCIIFASLFPVSCRTEIEAPKIKISAPDVKIDGGGGFCPPGQAKKGRS